MGYNFMNHCTFYTIDLNKIPDSKFVNLLKEDYGLDDNQNYIALDGLSIEDYRLKQGFDCFGDSIDYDDIEFDDEQLEETLKSYLGDYNYYLVFAQGCRWNGESGYKICTNINEVVYRDYDVTLEVESELSGRDGIVCREYSHDRPTGSDTVIMGITAEEYDQLEEMDFREIEEFVNSFK